MMVDKHLRILIAEDETAHVEAIRRALANGGLGAEVLAAETIRDFRRLAAEQSPDIALVDLNLPDGRATELLTPPPRLGPFPVLVMTSFEAARSGSGPWFRTPRTR